jgi:hypothetical protein
MGSIFGNRWMGAGAYSPGEDPLKPAGRDALPGAEFEIGAVA